MAGAPQPDAANGDELAGRMRGSVLGPDDPGYDAARAVWNARFDRRPSLIARCTGAADVMAAVDFARDGGLLLSVRGGGHSYAGNSVGQGGLLIDLSAMDAVRVDPAARTVRVQPGARWGAVDHETQAFGLATPGGTVSTVGVAGYTLGGGTGYLTRRHGLALDNLRSVDIVTAAGELVHASADRNPELFWAVRGGSGNFGVVTSFELRVHDVGPEALGGMILHRFEDAAGVLERYRGVMAEAPDALTCYPFFIHVPPDPAFPAGLHGEVALALVVGYTGPVDEGEAVLEPLRAVGEPVLDSVARLPYLMLQRMFDAGLPAGHRWYTRSHYLDELSDAAIETLVGGLEGLPGPLTSVYLEPLGGAVARVDPDATAFPHRGAAYSFHILAGWDDPAADDEITAWARTLHQAMAPHASGGVYVNLLAEDEPDRVRAAYGGNYERLARLKRVWDPDNLFRMNHNIRPAT